MKISGFTIARNAVRFGYPILESIRSILPICDEFIVNVGDSSDGTLELIQSLHDPKIKIIQNTWDMTMGKEVLSYQTNVALRACTGDWAFYLQSDEVVHENDLPRLKKLMLKHLHDPNVEALRFWWFHFYGSYFRYRIDAGWYQKQDRIIRNNGTIESVGDAYAFARRDGKDMKRLTTWCYIYHYGWVHSPEVMASRRKNASDIGFVQLTDRDNPDAYEFKKLDRCAIYFGTHPKTMKALIRNHAFSQEDYRRIRCKFWWFPPRLFKFRYKTGRRIRTKLEMEN